MVMITILFKMSKNKEKEYEKNVCNLSQKDHFIQANNAEVVPYLNNNGDGLQDILNVAENNTNDLQMQLISDNNDNVVEVSFGG